MAASNPQTTAREKQYIAAIAEIYSDAALKRSIRPDNKPNVEGYSAPDHAAEEPVKERRKPARPRR